MFAYPHVTLTLVTLLIGDSLGARILAYFPAPGLSHQLVFRPVLQALAARGHEITYVSAVPWESPHQNIDHRIVTIDMREIYRKNSVQENEGVETLAGKVSSVAMSAMYQKMINGVVEMALNHPVSQNLIHGNEKYDLVMSEAFLGYEAFTAFNHKFNATGVIYLSRGDTAWANEHCGFPDNPSYMVDFKSPYTDTMTFQQRLHNAYITSATLMMSYYYLWGTQRLMDAYFNYTGWESRPRVSILAADQALVLINSHHAVGYSYPKAPHVKNVGGTHLGQVHSPSETTRKFIDGAQNGIILFSLGSNIDFSMVSSSKLKTTFLNVFANRKERVLWKWSGKQTEDQYDNVLFSPWFSQEYVLSRNETVAFVTHGGLLSVMEAVNYGVPIIGIPIYGDQTKNVQQAVKAGYGLSLALSEITEDLLSSALDELINNPSYKSKAITLSAVFNDRPLKPIDEAVYWIEYALRNGKALQPASALMPFYQLYLLDVFSVIFIFPIMLMVLIKKLSQR